MAKVQSNGIEIEYEQFGDPKNPAVILIMGLGGQLTMWPVAMCESLAKKGYHVVRFDNRDIGLSTKLDDLGIPDMAQIMGALAAGQQATAPYSLDDMAADTVGLMDALGIEKAHVAGASMGGMIAQLVACNYPGRALSLTSIMSTTGNPEVPQGTPEAMAALMAQPDPAGGAEAIIQTGMNAWNVIGSPGYRTPEPELRAMVERDTKRSYHPQGVARQMAAIVANGDRREKLKKLSLPTVVLHGREDPLVPLAGGEDTAKNIPGAELKVVEGMGHDFPDSLAETYAEAVASAAARA